VWNVVGILNHYGVECSGLNGSGVVRARCPFHDDHRPSLSVFLESGWFSCFGCGWRGDLFDFVQAIEGVDDPVELLIRTYQASQSTDIRYHPYGRKFRPSSIKGLRLVTSYEKGPARYPMRRGVSESVLRMFRVLWDPSRYAVVFPVRWEGKWVGYQMRYVFAQSEPKYLFSVGFPRASVLYYSAEYGIKPRHPLLVVEGVFDVLKAVTFGWTHAAATFGAAVSDKQIEIIASLAGKHPVLSCMDADRAGMVANAVLYRALGDRFVYVRPLGGVKDVGDMKRDDFWYSIKRAWDNRRFIRRR
jgi:DNA primase